MAKVLSAATANGTSSQVKRVGGEVKSVLLHYVKTGTGTCTLAVHAAVSGAQLGDSLSVAATNPVTGSVEVPAADLMDVRLSSASGSFSVNAWLDGASS